MTRGITQTGSFRKNAARIVGSPIAVHGNGAGGAAFSARRLDERLWEDERPAHTDPDREAHTELRVDSPWRCPDSWMIGSDLVFVEPQTGQVQSTGMITASGEVHS